MDKFKQEITQLLNSQPELQALVELIRSRQSKVWLVGGVLRDLLLQRRHIADIDLAIAGDPTPLAKAWAVQVAGRWFWLDPERRQSRVLLRNGLTADFSPLRADTLGEDQLLRDFTINSLAFPLHQQSTAAVVLDPLNGIEHIQQRLLCICSQRSFPDDPLRMLKGIRHAVTLDMSLADATLAQLQADASLIATVAGERIREELGRILSANKCFTGIQLLLDTGLLAALFGPAGPDWNQSSALAALVALEQQMILAGLKLSAASDSPDRQEIYSQHTLFLLATLLKHYAAQNLPDLLHRRLRLSRQQQRLVLALQEAPADDWFKLVTSPVTSRRQALLVEQLGYAADEQLLYLAIGCNPLSYPRALELRQAFIEHQQLGRVPGLLSGEQILEISPNLSGQAIGNWQKKLKLAEITGKISSIEEAYRFLKEVN